MMPPLVSVIIPFYNNEHYLADAIQSVIDQTYSNVEIILVDDGAVDGSFAIAKKFEGKNIKVLRQKNRGASAARNFGLKSAKGEYIQFLDADDLLSTDKLTAQVNLLQINPGKIAVCNTVHFKEGDNPFFHGPSVYEEAFLIDSSPEAFLVNLWGGNSSNGSMVTIHAWLTPRYLIEKAGLWNEALNVDDDGEYFCRVVLQGQGVIKSSGYSYYRKYKASNNLSAGKSNKNLKSQLNAMILKFEHLSKRTDSPNLKQAYLKSLCQFKFVIYPFHPDLLYVANQEIDKINPDFKVDYHFPSKSGELINSLLGWKITRYCQLVKQYISNFFKD